VLHTLNIILTNDQQIINNALIVLLQLLASRMKSETTLLRGNFECPHKVFHYQDLKKKAMHSFIYFH